ncbi:MAG: SgcJ/EcaC family oxidoreductase [Deltaproteobacteria bacterium]|nr:SgcJ/EcaC family oxidoreductase [Deltaproteobacteria bacterium]
MGRNNRHTLMIGTVLVMILAVFGTGNGLAKGDETAVDKVRLAFNAAYSAGDAKAIASLIDRDAVFLPPAGEQAIIGAQKIAARYAAFFEKTHSAFELKPGKIEICGQWAFLSGSWNRKDSARAGGPMMQHGGYYMMVLKKQSDGSWKIARDIWNDVPKP